jgi:ABC-type lipoprotein release transport system permease subunit
MRTDLKRVTVTIVSIAGCCALILIGFSIYLAIKTTVSVQYDEIIKYNSAVTLDLNGNKNAVKDVTAVLDDKGVSSIPAHTESGALRIKNGTEPADYIVADLDTLKEYFVLRGKDGKVLTEPEINGVIIPSSYANSYNLSVGDKCMIIDSTGAGYRTSVAGIFENYLGSPVIISAKTYENIMCRELEYNTLLVKHDESERDAITEALKDVNGYDAIKRSDHLRQVYNSYSDLLMIMVFILIGAAAAMSAVILTNLVNICLLQKKRELTIMRVNGFTTKEVKNYVSREAIFTTVAGIVLGTAVGLLQMLNIMPALGRTYTQFVLTPNVIAIAASAALTALFTIVIYRITLRKVKDLKLTDIA